MEDTTMLEAPQPLFEDLTFTIVPTTLTADRVTQLICNIEECGGTVKPFDVSSGRIDELEEIGYIISATTDFPDYYRALDLMIHVVKPPWVEHCMKTGKNKNPRTYSPDPALFMSDVVVCCATDIPEGDQEAIAGGVLAMGGQHSLTLTKTTTHLIALSMENERCQIAVSKRINVQIILPHWFDDCLKVGRRLKEGPYLFPNPEIMNLEAGKVPPSVTSPNIREATNPEPEGEPLFSTPPAHLESPRAIRAFDGKKVKLGEDLNLNPRLKGVIVDMVKSSGGGLVTDIDEADIYVCNYRNGDDYVEASQASKDVGNLSWLYYLITHDTWTNPMRRMMHYPRPRDGIPGFEKYKISISSYTGEARVYLENLIKATGAEFTKTFKQDNTHLITAHKNSEKCDAAVEWNVHVVNHLWLEDAYAKCKEQTLTDPRYNFFPPRTNMGEILGSTELDRDAVEKMFYSKSRKQRPSKAASQSDVVPASSAVGKVTNAKVSRSSPAAKTGQRTRTTGDVATPVPARKFNDKENDTPGTAGSRGAKDRALSRLHESAGDIAQFEKEMKRKGGVIHGGRRSKDDETSDKPTKKGRDSPSSKRSIDEVEADDSTSEDETTEEPAKKNKKARKDKLTPIKYRMLLSKDERWRGNPDKESKDKARMRELGLFITDDSKKVDLLLAPKVVRTRKFVSALACGPTLVSSAYLDYALQKNKLPVPEKFPIDSTEFEEEHGFHFADAVARARQNKHRLLKDWTIFCTANVTGGFDTYKDIIVANGGQCSKWQGRSTTITAAKRKIDSQPKEVSQNLEEDEGDVLYLISEPKKSEIGLWKSFRELAEKHDMIPRIVKTEWLLHVAMAQHIRWKEEWELSEEVVESSTK